MTERNLMKFWLFIIRPFQLSKILEVMYALTWLAYAILSFLPADYVSGVLFIVLYAEIGQIATRLLMSIIAALSTAALVFNNIFIRQVMLFVNIAVLFFVGWKNLLQIPIPGGSVYILILAFLSIFSLWRMDKRY